MRIPGLNWLTQQKRIRKTRRGGVSATVRSEVTASLRSGMQQVAEVVRKEEHDTMPLSDSAHAAKRWLGEMLK